VCSFSISDSLSEAIATVGVVEWSTDLAGVTEARIDFDLVDPQPGELNVGSGGPIPLPDTPAFLLGMKPEREYRYRITVSADEEICVSPSQTLTTGIMEGAPTLTRETGPASDTQNVGFVLSCGYSTRRALIYDADGQVVWTVIPPGACTRMHMDWAGQQMWMMDGNPATAPAGGSLGLVERVRMDGTQREEIPGFERAHHDFTVLPDGTAAFLVVVENTNLDTAIVERAPDGTVSTLVVLNDESYLAGGSDTHPNALHYWAHDDSYTVSDLNVAGILNFDRQGNIQWQLGGGCYDPVEECQGMKLTGTHGHHWTESGNLLVFLAGIGMPSSSGPSPVVEYSFSGSISSSNASLEWFYEDTEESLILGDVQRLENGNTLITYSDAGVVSEVTPEKELVQNVSTSRGIGYTTFRKTLYGPPQ
jgi:hypothetical protein